jgi:pimeloyl-ACP methyl ester carboxylesterase
MKRLFAWAGVWSWFSLSSLFAQLPSAPKAGKVVIETASLAASASASVQYELGTLYVPENRADPKTRTIGVGFARFSALKPTGAPPVFLLPGGPGGSFVMSLQNPRQAASLAAYVGRFRAVGDVVLFDQRGYSPRGEVLQFKHRRPQPLDEPASLARHTSAYVEAARDAVAEFAGKGVDLRGYTVKECADDVNDLRKALGYERITLVGISFGSQWSFAVMRLHRGIVARALLAGVEPLNCGYDMPSHVLAAVQRQWWGAERDRGLRPYLPAGGLMAAAREILGRLDRAPLNVEVKDEKTGKRIKVTLGPEDFRRDFLALAANPSLLLSLYHGRSYETWARSVLAEREGKRAQPLIGPLIDTSLGVTPRRKHLLRTDAATALLGHWNFDSYLATADLWPSPDVGDDFRSEVVNDIPIIFAQGDCDTSTPLENLVEVAPYFPKARLLIAEQGRHDALMAILRHRPEVAAVLMDFLKSGNADKLPPRVTLPTPSFAALSFPAPSAEDKG